jgi:hypothetical protein
MRLCLGKTNLERIRASADADAVPGLTALAAPERQLDQRRVAVALRDHVVARHADRVDGVRAGVIARGREGHTAGGSSNR